MSCHDEALPLDEAATAGPTAGQVRSAPARTGVLAVVRDALTGVEHDFTSGPLGRAVILLAIPMVLETCMESLFAICDVFYVSRLGTDAVAVVGLTEAMMTVLYALAGGIATAATAMVARRIGEKRPDEAVTAAFQAMAVGLATAFAVAVPGVLLAPALLRLMGARPEVAAAGAGYTAWVLGGTVTVFLLYVTNAALRGAGNAARAMRALWIANLVNIVLDPCLIWGWGPFPELGLTGAAVATTLGRGIGVIYQVSVLARGGSRLVFSASTLRLQPRVMLDLARLAMGGAGQYLVANASWVVLMRLVGSFGSAAVAGYTIAIRILVFALLPPWGLASSAATLVGQNLGAGRPERAQRSVWIAGWYNTVFLLVVAGVFLAGAPVLVGCFTSDPTTLAQGVAALRIMSWGFGFYALGMVVVAALNGAGDTFTPTLINLGCYFGFQIPLATVLARGTALGVQGVFIAVPVAESLMTVVAVLVFRRGRWRRTRI